MGKWETWFWFSTFPSASSPELWECGNLAASWRDSQGARGKGGKPVFGFPRFPQARHFHSSLSAGFEMPASFALSLTLRLLILLRVLHSVTRDIQFDDHAMVH